jgi:heme-degrading monooxygenase HmoA
MTVYTLGLWRVKAGREDDFLTAWQELAHHTQRDFPGASAVLLRDRDTPNLFISSGPWESMGQVDAWRASDTFRHGTEKMRDLLDSFEAHTLDRAAVAGDELGHSI